MEGRTAQLSPNRLSTIVNSDVIMVMDRDTTRGNHASLMAERGTYYRLYNGGLEIHINKKAWALFSFFWLMDNDFLWNFP